jgi:hypothetical protein
MEKNKPATDIGERNELFTDNYLIYEMLNTSLRLNNPERREIVLKMEKPWEKKGSGIYSCVFKAPDGKYRMYYRGTGYSDTAKSDRSEKQYTCYAESNDGIHWTRTELGLIEFEKSKNNNILFSGRLAHNFSPFLDANPQASADAAYKAVAGYAPEGLMAFKSADGLSWEPLSQTPVITEGAFDSHNICFFDPAIGQYRCCSRYFAIPGTDRQINDFAGISAGVRAIQSNTSSDMLSWSKPIPNSYEEGVPLEHFYTNATIPCPGAEHLYLSFPMRFMPERHAVSEHPTVGVSDAVFMTSRDGVHFFRPFLDSWIRPDLDRRKWNQRNYITAWGILETADDEFSFYVCEHYGWEDAYIRRYVIPRHRFASVYGPPEGGVVITEPLIFSGRNLYLNYATAASGSIRVGIAADDTGWPAKGFSTEDCDSIYGNELKRNVTWKGNGDLSKFIGKPVRLKFELKAADLFALQFSSNASPIDRMKPGAKTPEKKRKEDEK